MNTAKYLNVATAEPADLKKLVAHIKARTIEDFVTKSAASLDKKRLTAWYEFFSWVLALEDDLTGYTPKHFRAVRAAQDALIDARPEVLD